MYQVIMTNFSIEKGSFEKFDDAVSCARKLGFECAIYDTSCETNWGSRLVAIVGVTNGLRDLRPFAGNPDPYEETGQGGPDA